MSTESDMIAAVNAGEAAAQQLAQAYTSYVAGYKSAASAVYAAAPDARASTATSELEGAVGAHLFAQNVASRLVALNAAPW